MELQQCEQETQCIKITLQVKDGTLVSEEEGDVGITNLIQELQPDGTTTLARYNSQFKGCK